MRPVREDRDQLRHRARADPVAGLIARGADEIDLRPPVGWDRATVRSGHGQSNLALCGGVAPDAEHRHVFMVGGASDAGGAASRGPRGGRVGEPLVARPSRAREVSALRREMEAETVLRALDDSEDRPAG